VVSIHSEISEVESDCNAPSRLEHCKTLASAAGSTEVAPAAPAPAAAATPLARSKSCARASSSGGRQLDLLQLAGRHPVRKGGYVLHAAPTPTHGLASPILADWALPGINSGEPGDQRVELCPPVDGCKLDAEVSGRAAGVGAAGGNGGGRSAQQGPSQPSLHALPPIFIGRSHKGRNLR
jgi:hypothetical protein